MSKQIQAPTITKSMFDDLESKLRAALKDWWTDEAQDFDSAVVGTAAIWDGLPEIDSKAVVKASPIVKKFIGTDLDPQLIRQGGYESFDELANDLIPKLRATCPSTIQDVRQDPHETKVEAINARKR